MRYLIGGTLLLLALLGTQAVADPYPKGFENHAFNGSIEPVTEGGITTFRILDKDCSSVDFGGGRGESDCYNGSVRNMLGYQPHAALGQTVEYSFDVRIDPALEYEGHLNIDAAGFEPGSWDSNLRLATWEGTNYLHNFIYILKVSSRAGVTFLGHQCQSPEQFGEWVRFSLKVKWTGDDKGWIAVRCNDKYIYVDEGVATNQAPHCYIQNQCEPGKKKDPKRILYIVGLQLAGWGYGWAEMGKDSPFIPIQEGGITATMRDMTVTRDAVLYGPEDKAVVTKLQETLNALGCDVGAADGVPGKRTKEAALSCKQFAQGAMPEELNVATIQTFLTLYTGGEVAVLPEGALPVAGDPVTIHVAQTGAERAGRDPEVITSLKGVVAGGPDGLDKVDFLIIGGYDFGRGDFDWLSLLLQDNIKQDAATAADACEGTRIENWGDGTRHLVIEFSPSPKHYGGPDADCIVAALPAPTSLQADFLLTHFADVAKSMVADGTLESVTHEGLKLFLGQVARGEVVVGR